MKSLHSIPDAEDGSLHEGQHVFIVSAFMDKSGNKDVGLQGNYIYLELLSYIPDYQKFQFIHQEIHCRLFVSSKGQFRHSWCKVKLATVTVLRSSANRGGGRSYEVIITCKYDDSELLQAHKYESASLSLTPTCTETPISNTMNRIHVGANVTPPTDVSNKNVSKATFAVCLIAPDIHTILQVPREHFVEFIKMNQILGAERIFISTVQDLPLDWFHRIGLGRKDVDLLEIVQHALPTHLGKGNDYKNLLINDCLYRNKHLYEYVLIAQELDILFPRWEKIDSWFQLVHAIEYYHRANIAAFSFRTLEFFDESSNVTSSYTWFDNARSVKLPRIVTHRLRSNLVNRTKEMASRFLLKPEKVVYVTTQNIVKLVPEYSTVFVPAKYGAIHKFSVSKGTLNRNEYIIDPSMDIYVPRLLKAMHRNFY